MKRRQQGFTLMEVLVAVAILAIALGAIISSVARTADNVGYLRDKTYAHWVAMNVLTETLASKAWPSVGSDDGKEEMANHEWHWKRVVSESASLAELRQIEIEVRRDRKDKQALARVKSLLGKP